MSRYLNRLFLAVILAVGPSLVSADDWPGFRGPNGDAISPAKAAPVGISADNTAWKTAIPGEGWSSPVYADGKIWITSSDVTAASAEQLAKKKKGVFFADMKEGAGSVKLRAICVDIESGRVLHNIQLHHETDPQLQHGMNSYASPTAAISNGRVVCHFGSYGTWCLDLSSGEKLWENRDIEVDHSVGPGSSPVIVNDVVILVFDGIDKQFVAGVSLANGKELWRTPRPKMRKSNGEFCKAYSTPLMIDVEGQPQAVIPGAQWMCAYDPKTGKELWRADCGDGFSTTPMAVYQSGLVICSTGFMSPALVAINPKGSGDVTKTNIVWRSRQGGSTMPTAVAAENMVYSLNDEGIITVLNAESGKIVSRVRAGGNYSSSPLLVAGKLYVGTREGVFSVFSLSDLSATRSGVKPLAKTKLDGDIMASPAMIGSDMIIRTSKSLMRVRPE